MDDLPYKMDTFKKLLEEIEDTYSDDLRLKTLLTLIANVAYIMGEKGL